jgi:hypothetical protein
MAAPLGMGENLRARDACAASPCVLIAYHASARAAAPCAILHCIISKTRKHFMIIEFKGMRPDVEKAAFTEEELQRQKKKAAVYTDDADEYANSIKIIG